MIFKIILPLYIVISIATAISFVLLYKKCAYELDKSDVYLSYGFAEVLVLTFYSAIPILHLLLLYACIFDEKRAIERVVNKRLTKGEKQKNEN